MKTTKDLAQSSIEERKAFLSSFDTVLFDCDGVLWTMTTAIIPGADSGVRALSSAKKDLFFLSNNTTNSKADLEKRFAPYGLNISLEKQYITPAETIVEYLQGIDFQKAIFLIGSSNLAQALRAHKFEVFEGPKYVEEGTYMKTLMDKAPNVGAVVFCSDLDLNLIKVHKAEMHLLDPECLLIFGATEDQYDLGKFALSAAGKFQKQLEDKLRRKPIVLGKPGDELGEIIKKRFADKKVLLIGDNMETDIGFANRLGFTSMLVFSGWTKRQQMDANKNEEQLPDYCVESMAKLGKLLSEAM